MCLDQLEPFTAASLFQCLIIGMIYDKTWSRLEFMMYNHHHILTYESWLVTISVPDPYFSPQDHVCLDQLKSFTSAWLFQCLIIDRIKIVSQGWDENSFSKMVIITCLLWVLIVGANLARPVTTFHTMIKCMLGRIHSFHISLTLPVSHHWYAKWLNKVNMRIRCL